MSVNALTSTSVNPSALKIDPASLSPAEAKQLRELDEAAHGFEQLFVKQLLETANFAKDMGSEGYGPMAMEALASSVSENGGMGLATLIRDSLIQSQLPNLVRRGR